MRLVLAVLLFLTGCASEIGDESIDAAEEEIRGRDLDRELRDVIAGEGLTAYPHASRYDADTARVRNIIRNRANIGRFLFFDHALSGVEQTSCGTCHHAEFQFTDARNIARGVFCTIEPDFSEIHCDGPAPAEGEDGNVVGPERSSPLNQRNTPTVINSALYPALMWNGRFHFVDDSSTDVNELDASLGFQFPAPENVMFTRSLLTAQAHIPVTEAIEMTGDFPRFGEPFPPPDVRNEEVRTALARRISGMPVYRRLFEASYAPGTSITEHDPVIRRGDPIPYLAIADAMGHFQEQDLVMTRSPWDHYIAGDDDALSERAKRGALIFYGRGRCGSCHSGDLLSDFVNYNIGVPQVGPGTGQSDASDRRYRGLSTWDFGLQEITGERGDRFRFRTPPLRGVAITSPYMHNGAYTRLEDAIMHHVNPRRSYATYDIDQIEEDMQAADGLKPMSPVFDHRNPVVIGPGTGVRPRIDEGDLDELIAFLVALTDPRMLELEAPAELPSGLPADVVGPRAFPLYPEADEDSDGR